VTSSLPSIHVNIIVTATITQAVVGVHNEAICSNLHRLHHLHWPHALWFGQEYGFGLGLGMSPVLQCGRSGVSTEPKQLYRIMDN